MTIPGIDIQLAEALRLCEIAETQDAQATPGPWEWWTSNSHRRLTREGGQDGGVAYGFTHSDGVGDIAISEEDQAFIKHARTSWPAIAKEMRRLIADRAEAKAKLESIVERYEAYNDAQSANHAAGIRHAISIMFPEPT